MLSLMARCSLLGTVLAVCILLPSTARAVDNPCDHTLYKLWVMDCDGTFLGTANVWEAWDDYLPQCGQQDDPLIYDHEAERLTQFYRTQGFNVTFQRATPKTAPPPSHPCNVGPGGGGLIDLLYTAFGAMGAFLALLLAVVFGVKF